jgi:hypothetical protein
VSAILPAKIDNNSNAIADNIYKAIQGIGTDEDAIIKAFSMVPTLNAFCSVHHSYGKTYGNTLFSDLDGDIDEESVWAGISRILRNLKQAPVAKPTVGGVSPQKPMAAAKPTTGTPQSPMAAAKPTTGTPQSQLGPNRNGVVKPTSQSSALPPPDKNLIRRQQRAGANGAIR